jgi:hypothetical protein
MAESCIICHRTSSFASNGSAAICSRQFSFQVLALSMTASRDGLACGEAVEPAAELATRVELFDEGT